MYSVIKQATKSILDERQISILKKLKQGLQLARHDIRYNKIGKIFPLKPTTLNLLVNDVCNSRCQMCSIWKNKNDKDISADELKTILSDDLFSNLKYVGISGGEPTLRSDLSDLFEVICSQKNSIIGTGIITNGIIEDVVKERVLDCAEVCKSHGVSFNVMVSLDGLDEVHDIVRGRRNNFKSAISLLNFFHHETDIPTSFGCTITSSNALYVDELLDYAKAEGLYGRFRVAEFIERLYNSEQTEFIRAFEDKIAYHIGLFFFRAEYDFEQNSTYKKTYRNIRYMIAEGKPRQIGCPYQSSSAVLTSRGELLYCSPKSPILGNSLQSSPSNIYFSNFDKRKEIIQKDCNNCIHDYHEPLTIQEMLNSLLKSRRRNSKYNFIGLVQKSSKIVKERNSITDLSHLKSRIVLIVGWYGTETVGDKAILWSIINKLRLRPNPPEKIYLSSLYPFISRWTVKEIKLGNISIVETYSKEFEKACDEADEIVVGGGPLMDIKPLDHLLYAFIQGAKQKAFTRIEGCGIGPLSSPVYTKVVSEIVRLSDHITLRDTASTERCLQEFAFSQVETVPDPATHYIQYVQGRREILEEVTPPLGKKSNVSCFLREWGKDYAGEMDELEYSLVKREFEAQLVQLLTFVAETKNLDIHLLPMHSFYIGGDDRIFNRHLAKSIAPLLEEKNLQLTVSFAREPISPLEILQSMYHSELNICMRFHSVLFAETLGVSYIAIDYTDGGKIKAFLKDKGKLDRLIPLKEVAAGRWKKDLTNLL